ncbi:hypothetical protein RB620_05500 [Paenibacillus sp. LHD-117]|uniref:hypothetical protein n=1 Tax=Paenibacillus sp. LHD-117 TaxID=3071412 RepID=UPI0027E1976E|nr:hypothetical protein [Paenibacillus sp. LHD-117]MDQ6418892.1 hypothetical protein [Paenibacillus sp. LHD-117]
MRLLIKTLILGSLLFTNLSEEQPHFISIKSEPPVINNWINLKQTDSLKIKLETSNTSFISFSIIPTGTNIDREYTNIGSLQGNEKNEWEFEWEPPKELNLHHHLLIKICNENYSKCEVNTLNILKDE